MVVNDKTPFLGRSHNPFECVASCMPPISLGKHKQRTIKLLPLPLRDYLSMHGLGISWEAHLNLKKPHDQSLGIMVKSPPDVFACETDERARVDWSTRAFPHRPVYPIQRRRMFLGKILKFWPQAHQSMDMRASIRKEKLPGF